MQHHAIYPNSVEKTNAHAMPCQWQHAPLGKVGIHPIPNNNMPNPPPRGTVRKRKKRPNENPTVPPQVISPSLCPPLPPPPASSSSCTHSCQVYSPIDLSPVVVGTLFIPSFINHTQPPHYPPPQYSSSPLPPPLPLVFLRLLCDHPLTCVGPCLGGASTGV